MKISIRKMLVVLAIVLSFTAVQAASAAEIIVRGTIERIGTGSIDVLVETTTGTTSYTFYDIPFSDLEAENITLSVNDTVTVFAYVVTFPSEKVKNIAYSITKGETTYSWHPNVPKAGAKTVTLSATDENGQPCHCKCIENTECYECHCYCGANR